MDHKSDISSIIYGLDKLSKTSSQYGHDCKKKKNKDHHKMSWKTKNPDNDVENCIENEDINEATDIDSCLMDNEDAPDGGWGWVVVFASFMVHVLTDGVTYSFGALTTELISHFGASRESVGWMVAIMVGMTLIAGPLASLLCNRYGFRAVTLTGSVISSVGFCAPFFYPKFWFIYLSSSILTGIGFGLVYLPSIVTVSIYFHKKRAFAIGLAVCGSGIGTFVFSPLIEYFNKEYGWQGTMLLVGGLIFNCFACGAIYRPLNQNCVSVSRCSSRNSLKSLKLSKRRNTDKSIENNKSSSIDAMENLTNKHENAHNYHLSAQIPTIVDPENRSDDIYNKAAAETIAHLAYSNRNVATVVPNSLTPPNDPPSLRVSSVPDFKDIAITSPSSKPSSHRHHHHPHHDGHHHATSKSSLQNIFQHPRLIITSQIDSKLAQSQYLHYPHPHPHHHRHSKHTTPPTGPSLNSSQNFYRQRSYSSREPPLQKIDTGNIALTALPAAAERKVASHPPKTAATSSSSSVCSLDSKKESLCSSRNNNTNSNCWKDNFDYDLLRNPLFLLFAFSNFFTSIGFNAPFLYAKDRAVQMNISNSRSSFLISSIGIGNTLGRVLFGYLSTKPFVNRLQLYNVSLVLSGVVVIFSCFAVTYPWMISYTLAFGLLTGTYVTLTSIVLVDLLGIEKLNASFGMTMVFQGAAVFIGPPMAGYIFDVTNSFDWSFWVCGGFLTLSGAMLYFVYCFKEFRNKKQKT